MNKHLLKICFIAVLIVSASSSYGADVNISGSTVLGGGSFSPSNKVNIYAFSISTGYSANSKHLSGDREIGTNNLDPKLHWTTASVGSVAATPGSADKDYSQWTTL